jgi:hypothetical protein
MFDRSDHEGIVIAGSVKKVGINGETNLLYRSTHLDPCQRSVAGYSLSESNYW